MYFLYGRFVGVGARRVRSLFQAAKKKVRWFMRHSLVTIM